MQSWFDRRGRDLGYVPAGKEKLNTKQTTIMPIPTGSKAPDFTLKSKQASGLVDVKLSNNFGKKNTVLLFFPLAFTGVCTQEMCDISGGLGAYDTLNANVYAISVDGRFWGAPWSEKENNTVKQLRVQNKTGIKAHGRLFPGLAGIGDSPALAGFVIDNQA